MPAVTKITNYYALKRGLMLKYILYVYGKVYTLCIWKSIYSMYMEKYILYVYGKGQLPALEVWGALGVKQQVFCLNAQA